MSKASKVHVTETVDHGTGEIKHTQTVSTYAIDQEPAFVKMYIEDIVRLNNLNNIAKSLLTSLTKRIDYENIIRITPRDKREMAREAGTEHIQTISNSLSALSKAGVISRIDIGMYMLNPAFFAKGKWIDIKNTLIKYATLNIKYTNDGRKIESDIVFEKK